MIKQFKIDETSIKSRDINGRNIAQEERENTQKKELGNLGWMKE